jgi:hypothetical protein
MVRAAATLMTLGVAVAAAVHVSGHVKDSPAPLRPGVVGGGQVAATISGGRLSLSPSVRSGRVQSVTSTYES